MSRSFPGAPRAEAPMMFGNRLLDGLSAEARRALQPYLREEAWRARHTLVEPGKVPT